MADWLTSAANRIEDGIKDRYNRVSVGAEGSRSATRTEWLQDVKPRDIREMAVPVHRYVQPMFPVTFVILDRHPVTRKVPQTLNSDIRESVQRFVEFSHERVS